MDHQDNAESRYLSAVEMNNRAISYFEGNKKCIANECLRDALTSLRDDAKYATIAIDENDQLSCDEDDESWCSREIEGNLCRSGEMQRLSVKGTPVPLSSKNEMKQSSSTFVELDSIVAIYDRAIFLGTTSDPYVGFSLLDQEYMSSAVLYNMALLNHTKGIELGKSSFLLRAIQLYKISFEIIQARIEEDIEDEDDIDSFGCNQYVTLLLMALFNNMAHALSLLYRIEEMQQVLEHLSDIISAASDGETQCPKMNSEDRAIFYMNAMVTHESQLPVAAAA